jgi:hypothetical protein
MADAQLNKLLAKIEALKADAKQKIAGVIREAMVENDISIADLAGLSQKKAGRPKAAAAPKAKPTAKKAAKPAAKPSKKTAAKPVAKKRTNSLKGRTYPPKYRHPETGATWSGIARVPAWIAEAPDREVFRIPAEA